MGGLVPALVAHTVIVAVTLAVGTVVIGSHSSNPRDHEWAVDYLRSVHFWRGTPTRPLPGPPPDRLERLRWLKDDTPWTFEVVGASEVARDGGPGSDRSL